MTVTIIRLALLTVGMLSGLSACGPSASIKASLRPSGDDPALISIVAAQALVGEGRHVEAISAFRRLLRQDGPSIGVLNGLAIAYAELGRPDLAADHFAEALALAPDDPSTLNNIGYAALRRKEPGLARRYLERAKAAGGEAEEIAGNLAVLQVLEARQIKAGAAKASFHASRAGNARVTLRRKSATTLQLEGLRAVTDQPTVRGALALSSSTALIDFDEIFDPWSMPAVPSETATEEETPLS